MNLLMSEKIPLRTTQVLGNFAESTILPHRYGNLSAARFKLIRLDDYRYLAADHWMTVTKVFTDRQKTTSWEARVESDDAGHVWTVVVFATPVPLTAEVTACGYGKVNPVTGALITSPADVMTDFARLHGRTILWGPLRAECSAEGIEIALSLDESISLREACDNVAKSIGAIWVPGYATLYPTAAVTGHVLELERDHALAGLLEADTNDTCDILRVGFDREDATGRPQKHIELSANPHRYGGATVTLELPYVRSMAAAEKISTRLLQRMAGERYRVPVNSDKTSVRPGQWVRLIDPADWPFANETPVIKVLGIEANYGNRSAKWAAEYLRTIPSVEVTAYSVALPDTAEAGVEVTVRNGIATFTIFDKDGKPFSGVTVQFDGGTIKSTNAQGQVSFNTTPGWHELLIEATGYETLPVRVKT